MSGSISYPFLSLSRNVQDICKPLANIKTDCLVFVRRYANGNEVCLSTDPGWTQYFYDNKLYKSLILDEKAPEPLTFLKARVYPWTQFENSKVRIDQSKYFGVGLGLSIEYPRDDHVDLFHFGTKNENVEMKELYLSYLEHLISFGYHFYEKTKKFLEGTNSEKYLIKLKDRKAYSGDLNLKSNANYNYYLLSNIPEDLAVHQQRKDIFIRKNGYSYELYYVLIETEEYNLESPIVIDKKSKHTQLKNILDRKRPSDRNLNFSREVDLIRLINELVTSNGGYTCDHDHIYNFNKQTEVNSFLLHSKRKGNVMITKRQAQCLYYLARGFTSSEIANKWCRSKKDVEKIIENTKIKLGIEKGEKKKDLIAEGFPLILDLLNLGLIDKE